MVMRKLFNSLFVIIAAVVTFAGCTKQEIENYVGDAVTVHFVAESIETKSAFGSPDGTTYPTLWTENDEKIHILLNLNEEAEAGITVSEDYRTATFSADIVAQSSTAPYTFYAVSPASAYLGKNAERFSATIPAAQTPLAGSVDEAAQILYAISSSYTEMPSNVPLNFKHFTAYGNLSFTNLELDGAVVSSVSITSSVNIAGRWNYMVADGSYTENSASSTITLNTSSTENIWFACAPVDMDGQTLTFTINTDKGPISKSVSLAGKKFEAGKIAKMTVDMTGVKFAEPEVYELVYSASELTANSKVIIVASDSEYALSTTQNGNNRGQAAVTKSSDKSTISDPGNDVQIITVENGAVDGTIAFNVGNGYLYAASSSSNYLRTEATLSANSSWKVEISAGVATVKSQGTYTRNWLRYNSGSSLFSCYSTGQKDVAIYKLKGSGASEETPMIIVTSAKDQTIGVEGGDLEFEYTLENLDGQTLTLTKDADFLTATDENGVISVTVAENTTAAKRVATITLSCGEAEDVILTVTQEAGVQVVTVSEFLNASEDETVYQLTGTISRIATAYNSSYNNISFFLQDSTGEVQIYRMSCVGVADPTSLTVGDEITVQGCRSSYNGTAQMAAAGKYVSHTDKDAPTATVVKASVEEFINAAEDATIYELTGTISSIKTAYNSSYNNISFFLQDSTGEVQIYRMSCVGVADPTSLSVGDEITVQGYRSSYSGTAQMAADGKYISHTDK